MIARLAGVAVDARVATRTSDPRKRALAAQWIAANVLGVPGIRARLDGDAPQEAQVITVHTRNLTGALAVIAAIPALLDPTSLPWRWRAALHLFGIPVLDRPAALAVASGASVAVVV